MIVHLPTGAQSLNKAEEHLFADNFREAITEYNGLIKTENKVAPLDLGNCYLRRGHCLFQLQKTDSSIADFFKALKIFEEIKNTERMAAANNNIGNAYYRKTDITLAEKYFNQSFAQYNRVNDTLNIIKCLNNLALIASDKNDTLGAIQWHRQAINNFPDKIEFPIFAKHYQNLANCYMYRNNDSAIYYNNKALENASLNGDSTLIASFINNIGSLHLQRGDYQRALPFFMQSESIYKFYPDSLSEAVVYHNLAEVYDKLGYYKSAYDYSVKERDYSEQLLNREKFKISSELAEKYESEKKDAEILNQENRNKLKSRNLGLSFIALGLVALLAAISFINYKKKQKANGLLQQQNNHILALNKQLDESNLVKTKLFSIISHDLRSPVSSLFAYLQLMQQSNKMPSCQATLAITRQTENLLETMEDLLIWSKSQLQQFNREYVTVNLHRLINETKDLFSNDIVNKKLQVNNEVSESKATLITDSNMFTIIIRNLLGNAVQNSIPGSQISISLSKKEDLNIIQFKNTTSLSEKEVLSSLNSELVNSQKYGLGKILIQEFTEKLNGKIEYSFKQGYLRCILSLPVR
jgi:signal transduction histidine kinase